MFGRILIANRGEIAVRVIRACRELGIASIAVYSDADARAKHVRLADHAVRIGPPPAGESYLNAAAILAAARDTKADAIHPGYGFLSENASFAAACAQAGVAFIGPSAEAIERMGSKVAARAIAEGAGVPVVPGGIPDAQTNDAIIAVAERTGFPLLLKPSAGGGGIGMKVVREAAALPDAITQGRREAVSAFGDGTLYVERLVERPRHVEFQVLADHHGQVIHLFERECSIQRRHQKVIEETPSTVVTPVLRRRMGEAAVAVTRAAGYRNAGTIEFLVEGSGDSARFYFLEMNTRLQVEHPVTEEVLDVDLVKAQIAIASGDRLPWAQDALTQRGHAIECRVYAEDPATDLPQAGPLVLYREPSGPGVRIDSGFSEGDAVDVHYDPMLAKLIAHGETRESARRRALVALRSFPILGLRTNIPLLIELLEHPRFISGELDTHFLDTEGDAIRARLATEPPAEVLAVAAAARSHATETPTSTGPPVNDPWSSLRGVRV
jgi:3-methylcrotonyl-CoA carboxylase alpha subunit